MAAILENSGGFCSLDLGFFNLKAAASNSFKNYCGCFINKLSNSLILPTNYFLKELKKTGQWKEIMKMTEKKFSLKK